MSVNPMTAHHWVVAGITAQHWMQIQARHTCQAYTAKPISRHQTVQRNSIDRFSEKSILDDISTVISSYIRIKKAHVPPCVAPLWTSTKNPVNGYSVSFTSTILRMISRAELAKRSHDAISVHEHDGLRQTSLASLQDRLDSVEHQVFTSVPGTPRTLLPFPSHPPHRQLANPSPLGLFGFALVSILAGAIKMTTDPVARSAALLAGTAFFLGGLAQVVASIFQFLNNNVHSATTFAVFGFHWSTQSFILTIRGLADVSFVNDSPAGVTAVYFAVLTVVTIILWIPTFRMNRILQATLFFVILAFGFDVGAAFRNRPCEIISGIAAIIASALALYLALLDLVNEAWKRPVFPLFPNKEHKHEYDSQEGLPYVPKRTYHKSAFGSVHL